MNHMNTKQCARLGITTVQEKNLALEEKLVALEKEKERCQMPLGDVAVNLRENSGKLHLWINQSASRDFQTWFFLQDFACVASLSIPYCIVYLYVPYICIYLIKPYLMLLPYYWHGSTSKTCFVHLYTMLGQPIATHQRFRAVCIQLWRRLKREEESIMKLKDRPSPTPRPIFGDVWCRI